MLLLIDAALRHLQILHPTPLKRAWLLLTVIAVLLKIVAIFKIPFPALKLYLGAIIIEVLVRSGWGTAGELCLILFVLAFVYECLYLSGFGVRYAFVRKYDQHFALGSGGLIVSLMIVFPPMIYANYPSVGAYIHVYSSAFAAVTVAAATVHSWNRMIKSDLFLRLHFTISALWFAIPVWCALSKADPWKILLIGTAAEVVCLSAWLLAWKFIGSAQATASVFRTIAVQSPATNCLDSTDPDRADAR